MEIQMILDRLSLKDKLRLCSGRDFWHTHRLLQFGLPAVMMCDGPHGLRCQKGKTDILGVHNSQPATCFPTACTTACSFDPELLGQIGRAIGEEARTNGVALVLGPGVNLKRDPLCGRNFEYFSEDPYLTGRLATEYIRQLQTTGVGACIKHFALNNQEYKRCSGNSQVDRRTMEELYLAAFEMPVREGKPQAVMCAYNQVNGEYCSDSHFLLTNILRQKWGFDGLVVTDWGAMHNRVTAMKAGCDLMMPGGSDYMEKALWQAVQDGSLSETEIDRCVMRILRLMERGHTLQPRLCNLQAHHKLAVKAATQSAVLLKNHGNILPLQYHQSVALIGAMANTPRYQGSGSSHINPLQLVSAVQAMAHGIYAPGCKEDGSTDEALLQQAVEAAKQAQVAVVFAGLPAVCESEGFDRQDLKMPEGHLQLIDAVAQANPNTVVVLCCGGVVECPWAHRVKGILYMGLAGEGIGEAVREVLYGFSDPGGRLAESWPYAYEDCPTAGIYRNTRDPQYREGLYVGYRYYDKAKKEVRWPFGYGLSYTRFQFSDLNVQKNTVTCTVKNIGHRPGYQVAQLYIAPPQTGLHRPLQELKGFRKVFLQPGESATVSFQLDERSFALWQTSWQVPKGTYTVRICTDSRTEVLSQTIAMEGVTLPAPPWQRGSWYERPSGTPSLKQWRVLYPGFQPEYVPEKGDFSMDSTLVEMKDSSLIARLIYRGIEKTLRRSCGPEGQKDGSYAMLLVSATDTPLRNMQMCSGIKSNVMTALMHFANGSFFRGILSLLGLGVAYHNLQEE